MPTRRPSLGTAPLLPGILLVIIIFWALAAVLMLTGTLINAREIKDTVDVINSQVQPIDKDLDSVKLAGETVKISGGIDKAAKPLSRQATQVNSAAKAINTTAQKILVTAGSINRIVKQINGTATAINGQVTSINGTVVSINGTVNAIGGNVSSISGKVSSIGGSVGSINSRARRIRAGVGPINASGGTTINGLVGSILRTFKPLNRTVENIESGSSAFDTVSRGGGDQDGVDNINRRAQTAIGSIGLIKADFDGILGNVGFGIGPNGPDHGTATNAAIHGHANSIDCSPLFRLDLSNPLTVANTVVSALVAIGLLPPGFTQTPTGTLGAGTTQYCDK